MANNEKVNFYENMSKQLGPFGAADSHWVSWAWDGKDIIGNFRNYPCLRVSPDNSATMALPPVAWRTPAFVNHMGYRFGISSITHKKTLSSGVVAVLQLKNKLIETPDGLLKGTYVGVTNGIDYGGSWTATAATPVEKKQIDRKKIAARVAEIREKVKVHTVTARMLNLGDNTSDWRKHMEEDWKTPSVERLQRFEFKDFAYFIVTTGYWDDRAEPKGWANAIEHALKRNKAELCGRENLYL